MIRVQVSCIAMRENQVALIKKITPDSGTVFNRLIPPGGHVEPWETLEEACAREMREETGLEVNGLELVGVVSFLSHVSEYSSVCFLYRADQVTGELRTGEPEKMEAHWVDIDEVKRHRDIKDYHRFFINHAVKGEGVLNARVEWFIPNEHTFTLVSKAANQKLDRK